MGFQKVRGGEGPEGPEGEKLFSECRHIPNFWVKNEGGGGGYMPVFTVRKYS